METLPLLAIQIPFFAAMHNSNSQLRLPCSCSTSLNTCTPLLKKFQHLQLIAVLELSRGNNDRSSITWYYQFLNSEPVCARANLNVFETVPITSAAFGNVQSKNHAIQRRCKVCTIFPKFRLPDIVIDSEFTTLTNQGILQFWISISTDIPIAEDID